MKNNGTCTCYPQPLASREWRKQYVVVCYIACISVALRPVAGRSLLHKKTDNWEEDEEEEKRKKELKDQKMYVLFPHFALCLLQVLITPRPVQPIVALCGK